MKGAVIHVALLFVGMPYPMGAARGEAQGQAHPVVKVIGMLEGLMAKTEAMGKVEAGSYAKYVDWCQVQSRTLKNAIEEEKDKISELGDTISGKTKEQKGLETQLEELIEQITDMEASAMKADKMRADEAAVYKDALEDLKGTVKAVEDALDGMKNAGVEQKGLLFAQRKAKQALSQIGAFATEEQRQAIHAFLQENEAAVPSLQAKGDKGAALEKYNFKSGNVIDLLKAMKAKFEDERSGAIKAETNALNAYELSSKARDEARQAALDSKASKEVELGEAKQAISDAKGETENQKADQEADSSSLSETEQSCSTKKDEWEKRSQTRDLELEAMETAIKILAKVTGVRHEKPNNAALPGSPVKLLQIAALDAGADPKLRAVNLLKETAKTVHSQALERLAVAISAHLDGPFDQVNNMVQKMIFRLKDEQTQEDNHKHWCDLELSKTNTMKDNKDDKLEALEAKFQAETASVAQLTEDVKAADTMISDIVASMKTATEIRNEGKTENKEVIDDSEKAQKAILQAIEVLEAFYKDSGMIQEENFLQAPHDLPESPSTWDSGYTGVSDPQNQPNGIISMLKAVNADFEKLEAETRSQETTDQHAFDEQIKTEKIEKARRTQEVEMKGNRKMQKTDLISQIKGTKKNVGSEQEKAVQYLKDLESACISGDSTYEKRKEARDEEIAALGKAQGFLEDAFRGRSAAFLSKAEIHVPK